jgi:hypothetical protein
LAMWRDKTSHINLEPGKLGRELRKLIQLSLRGAKFEW